MENLDTLVKQWNAISKKDRHSFYSNAILPQVANLLNLQYKNYLSINKIKPYNTLITTLSFDINIVLLMLQAIQPQYCVVFYTQEKEKLAKKLNEITASLNVTLHLIEIDSLQHSNNIEKIKNTIKTYSKQSPPVLCDITGGKKIISTQIGIIAHSFKIDIAYIDSKKGFLQWGIPYPGNELLYIQKPDNLFALLETAPANSLRIRFIPETNTIEYEALIYGIEHRRLGAKIIKKNHTQSLAHIINNFYNSMNYSILYNSNACTELIHFGTTLKSLLFTKELTTFLTKNSNILTHLIIDEELHAIPWEIILSQCNVSLPLIRIPNRDINYTVNVQSGKSKSVAFITGSGSNIPDFNETVHKIKLLLSKEKSIILHTIDAKNSFALKSFFAQHSHKPFSLVIYYGHAQFGNCNDNTGLVCQDGSIFSTDDLDVFDTFPPQCMLVNACQSARCDLFSKNSFAYAALKAGVETYIGTDFLLEFNKSKVFIQSFIHHIINDETYVNAYKKTIADIEHTFGNNDVTIFNYICYGY